MDVEDGQSGDYKEEEHSGTMSVIRKRPFRITDCRRTTKKGIVASSYTDLIQQCSQRFEMIINQVVLEDDGTEVDTIYFETLPQNCVLMILSNGQVWSRPGIPSTGQEAAHRDVNHRVMAIVEHIRKAETASTSRAANTNVTCTCGWQHFSYQLNKYIMVKNTKSHPNLGPRSISISRTANESDILEILIGVFFPRGKSVKGRIESMDVKLGSYKAVAITDISATLRATKPHVYLLTKEKLPEIVSSASSDSDDLPDPEISPPALTFTQHTDRTQPSSTQGLAMLIDRTQSSSSQGLNSMLNDRTQPSSSHGLTILTERTQPSSSQGLTILTERTQPSSSQGLTILTERTQPSSSQGLTMLTERSQSPPQGLTTQSLSQGLAMLTDRTLPLSQDLTMLTDRPQSSSQVYGYATPQRNGTVVYSRSSNGSTDAPFLATLWNETGTPEVCIQSRKCTICYDKEVTAFLVPCAHKFCMACCRRVHSLGQRCPLCRMEIANVGALQTNNEN